MFVPLEVILFATAASAVVARGAPEYANNTYDYVSVTDHSVDDISRIG